MGNPVRLTLVTTSLLAASVTLNALSGCTLFAAQAPCQGDHNCLDDQICDQETRTCVERATADAGDPSADSGVTDSAVADVVVADVVVADRASIDVAADDAAVAADAAVADVAQDDIGVADASGEDQSSPDVSLPDSALASDGGPEICDGLDNDRDGDVDEGCDDDGDGYCDAEMTVVGSPPVCPASAPDTADDCDDTLPTCTTDCDSNSDLDDPAVVDCVEQFCGSDPLDVASVCHIVTSRSSGNAAIAAINQEDGVADHILLEQTLLSDDGLNDITSDDGLTVRQRPGATLRLTSHPHEKLAFDVYGDNVTFEGVHFVNVKNANTWIEFHGISGTMRHCLVEGYEKNGVRLSGASRTVIHDNVFLDGEGSDEDGEAAIFVDSSDQTFIVGNLVAGCEAGVHLEDAAGVWIDHNTFADVRNDALRFHDAASAGLCMRSNLVVAADSAIDFEVDVAWDESSACVGPLDSGSSGPDYGNAIHDLVSLCEDRCPATAEADCAACLPAGAGAFFEHETDPMFTTTISGEAGFYCPGAGALIDAGDALSSSDPLYDRNGLQPGMYNGAAPDIGGRELGSAACAQ